MGDFKLSASLKGHEDDVRDLAFPTPNNLLSASRDATVRSWQAKSSSPPDFDDTIVSHGSGFINAVTYLPPTKDFPEGLILSGGKETIIEGRQPGRPPDGDAERLLLGHQGNVCSLDAYTDDKTSYAVSGSWDASAMVWDVSKGECTAVLEGHTGSVWSVLAFDKERILTGCADHLIRIYSTTGKLVKTLKGSTDVVRALCRLPDKNPFRAQFASAGNDATIRLWTLEGKQLAQLSGHDSFIYSLATLPTGEIVSSGEDRTLRVWSEHDCIQTITHPAISVWTVAVCAETGDIASGASDRMIRVFSRSPERQAAKEFIEAFHESVQGSSIPKQAVGNGDVKKDELPTPDFLEKKSGTKEGQVQMIRQPNGSVTAHTWSHMAQQWLNVGTVVDAAGSSGRRQEHMGQDYDYVFDIDVAEGQLPLKLPYNSNQNPYEVAQKFIADNELPTGYVQQVSNFIIQNTQTTTFEQRSGSSSGITASQPRPKVLPQKEYLTIATANFGIISRKLQELNSQLLADGRKDIALNPGDLKLMPDFVATLESTLTKPASSERSQTLVTGANVLTHMITSWPPEKRIPALDLYRCLAACQPPPSPLSILKASGTFPQHSEGISTNPNMTMLALRGIANLFATPSGRSFLGEHANGDEALELVASCIQGTSGTPNRNVLIAATTFYVNYAVFLHSASTIEPEGKNHAAKTARTILQHLAGLLGNAKVVDSEAVYRALVAVGTLIQVPGAKGEESEVERVESVVKSAGERFKEPRIKAVIGEIMPEVCPSKDGALWC